MAESIIEIEPSDDLKQLLGNQTGVFKFDLTDQTRTFAVIDTDVTTQDLAFGAWFSKLIYFDPLYFENYLYLQSVQQQKPLMISVSSTGETYGANIASGNGTFYFNLENRSGAVKTFLFKEINT